MDDTITGNCPKCGESVEFPHQFAGHKTSCPECGAEMTLGAMPPATPSAPPATPSLPPATPSAPPTTPSAPPVVDNAPSFKVVPFTANLNQSDKLNIAGQQLENALNHYSGLGYDYVRMEQLSINVKPGCLAAFFGGSATTILYDFIVFKKRG